MPPRRSSRHVSAADADSAVESLEQRAISTRTRTVTASTRRRGASARAEPAVVAAEESVARELSFEETTDADAADHSPSSPLASLLDARPEPRSAKGRRPPQQTQAIAERDSAVFVVDACDWIAQDPHDVLKPSTPLMKPRTPGPVRPMSPAAAATIPTSASKYAASSSSSSSTTTTTTTTSGVSMTSSSSSSTYPASPTARSPARAPATPSQAYAAYSQQSQAHTQAQALQQQQQVGSTAAFWDDVYSVFPFFFKGIPMGITISLASLIHANTARKLTALHARYGPRPLPTAWKAILLLALLAVFAAVSGPAVQWVRAQGSSGPIQLSNGGSVTERDMQRIGDRVVAAVKANVGTLDLATEARVAAAERALTKAFTALNGELTARAGKDLTAAREELLALLRAQVAAAAKTAKADTDAARAAAEKGFASKTELAAAVAAGKSDVAVVAAAAASKYVTHPELAAVEKKLTEWMDSKVAAQATAAAAALDKAAQAANEALRKEVAASATATGKDVELLHVKLTSLVETEVLKASQASQASWSAALERMRLDLAGGNFVDSLTAQVRDKIMDGVTSDATKAAVSAAERAGKATLEATIAASVKAARAEAAERAKEEADKAVAVAFAAYAPAATASVASSSGSTGPDPRLTAAIEKAHSAAAEASRAQADSKVAAAKADAAAATAKQALDVANKLQDAASADAAAAEAKLKASFEALLTSGSPAWARAQASLLSQAATAAEAVADSVRKELAASVASLAETVRAEQGKLSTVSAAVTALEPRVAAVEKTAEGHAAAVKQAQSKADAAAETAAAAAEALAELRGRVEALSKGAGAAAVAGKGAPEGVAQSAELQRVLVLIAQLETRVEATTASVATTAAEAAEAAKVAQAAAETRAAAASRETEFAAALAKSSAQIDALEARVAELAAAAETAAAAAAAARTEAGSAQAAAHAATIAAASGVDEGVLRAHIDDALEVYAADRTALVDYATKGAGGRVVAHTETHVPTFSSNNLLSWLTSCYVQTKPADTMLEPSMDAGSCWPMRGSSGFFVIKLAAPIRVTKLTIQHVSRTMANNINSAPRALRLFGITTQALEAWREAGTAEPAGVLLGEFTYDAFGPRALQTFNVPASAAAGRVGYSHVKVEVMDNHGNEDYTCIYRVRVHGEPVKPAADVAGGAGSK